MNNDKMSIEIGKLNDNINNVIKILSVLFNTTESSIRRQILKTQKDILINDDIKFIEESKNDRLTNKQIAEKLDIEPYNVAIIASKFNIRKRKLTEEEKEENKKNYDIRVKDYFNDKLKERNHKSRKYAVKNKMIWSYEDDHFLKDNYGKMSTEELAKILGRTVAAVANRACILNIKFYK